MKEKNFLQISLNLVKVLTANLHRMQSLIIAELPPAILHQLVSMDLPAPLFGTCFPPISHLVTHFQLECEFRSSTMAEMLSALAAIPFLKTFNMSQNYFPTCPRITLVKTQFQRSVWFWKAWAIWFSAAPLIVAPSSWIILKGFPHRVISKYTRIWGRLRLGSFTFCCTWYPSQTESWNPVVDPTILAYIWITFTSIFPAVIRFLILGK